jgi:hypothetical protein
LLLLQTTLAHYQPWVMSGRGDLDILADLVQRGRFRMTKSIGQCDLRATSVPKVVDIKTAEKAIMATASGANTACKALF